jgi:hypothetical protein
MKSPSVLPVNNHTFAGVIKQFRYQVAAKNPAILLGINEVVPVPTIYFVKKACSTGQFCQNITPA